MALTKEEIKRKMTELFHEVEDITKVDGVDNLPGCEGMLIYEEPLIGFASADDPLFEEYKKPHVIGENYLSPREWMEDTETIISFFLPFREEIRKSNRDNKIMSSKEWLHARFEGQNLLNIYTVRIRQWLEEQGVHVCIPAIDERFAQKITPSWRESPAAWAFTSPATGPSATPPMPPVWAPSASPGHSSRKKASPDASAVCSSV